MDVTPTWQSIGGYIASGIAARDVKAADLLDYLLAEADAAGIKMAPPKKVIPLMRSHAERRFGGVKRH